ncbi:MAG: DUF1800 family protein [Betaproteobacteria bacterium]
MKRHNNYRITRLRGPWQSIAIIFLSVLLLAWPSPGAHAQQGEPVQLRKLGPKYAAPPGSISAAATLLKVYSRKTHGSAGQFDLTVDPIPAITGAITIEPRAIGAAHVLVFRFSETVTSTGTVSVVDAGGNALGTVSLEMSGTDVLATITNIPDKRRATIVLTGVTTASGSTNASASIGFLVGDFDNLASVATLDRTNVKSRAGQTAVLANFKYDVDTSGLITAADIAAVKARVGQSLGTAAPPSVSLASIADAPMGTLVALNATASVATGTITRVEFFDGSAKIGEDTTSPYSFSWSLSTEGAHQITAKVTDSNGASALSTPVSVTVGPHPQADAARLLTQATFGATQAEITRVAAMTPTAYLDEQFAKPQTLHVPTVSADPNYPTAPYSVMMPSVWQKYFESQDQLRHRVAYALSQIMVVSMQNNTIGDQACGMASYLDLLGANAFGNFRDLLKGITLSPAMGEYLDMKGSAKADPVLNLIPNENYAREVMQLFTIGTVMLNTDGSVQLDGSSKPINTYSEADAQAVARAFTGWNFARPAADNTNPYRWLYPDVPYPSDAASAAKACTAWSSAMQPWTTSYRSSDNTRTITGGAHDSTAKTLLTYPGSATHSQNVPAGQAPDQDIDSVVDNLFNHPNVGPFIGAQLIQRLVTSNPSPAYVGRIAAVFNNNGSGVRGDMKAVVRAILLDTEARAPRTSQPNSFGKLREPVLRFTHLHRAFGAVMTNGYRSIYDLGSSDSLGQSPLHAPSVFNFYAPDYTPSGPLAQADLVGPEFGITTSATLSGFIDFSKYGILGGFNNGAVNPGDRLAPDYSQYIAKAPTPEAMVDSLNLLLLSGGMSLQLRKQLVDVATKLTDSVPATQNLERFKTVFWLILTSPEYSIQK